jgi:sugar (pentulose or hexulose) kinase
MEELGDRSLRQVMKQEGVNAVAGSAWGANLMMIDANNKGIAAVDYMSAYGHFIVRQFIRAIDPLWWHRTFRGAVKAEHQHVGVLSIMAQYLPREAWEKCAAIVPVWDWIMYQASGVAVHDKAQLQSWGLSGDGPRVVETFLGEPLRPGMICPWSTLDTDDIVKGKDGVSYIGSTHDTPMANTIGFSTGARYCAATGSWIMASVNISDKHLEPSDKTCDLGFQFEGLSPPAAITNTTMIGPAWRQLVRVKAKWEWDQGAKKALSVTEELPNIDPGAFQNMSAEEGVQHVLRKLDLPDEKSSYPKAAAAMIKCAVAGVSANFRKQAEFLGESADKFAVVGGFSGNEAFCSGLEEEMDGEVVIPPMAPDATEAGVALDAYRRLLKADSIEMPTNQILQHMPTLES